MEADYPAAHSMDTTWFAVDRDGFVAVFASGETGAVPVDAIAADVYELSDRLQDVLPTGERLWDPAPATAPGVRRPQHYETPNPECPPLLMFLPDLAAVGEYLKPGRGVEVPAFCGTAVLWRGLSTVAWRQLHEQGVCLTCRVLWDDEIPEEYGVDRTPGWAYTYEEVGDAPAASGLYARFSAPRRALRLQEFPPDLRWEISRIRFAGLSFANTPYFQPVTFARCESWQPAYLEPDGRIIRPMPGREDDYREAYEEWLGKLTDFEAVPPR
jgi:hypothetical protein